MLTSQGVDDVNGSNGPMIINGSTGTSQQNPPKMVNGTKEKKPNIFRRIIRRPKKTQQPKVAGTIVATPAEINEATAKLFARLEERYATIDRSALAIETNSHLP